MSNILKLAAAIKIRNKEIEFTKVANAALLSKINPTSFRNTALPTIGGLGVTGIGVGLSNLINPVFGKITDSVTHGHALTGDLIKAKGRKAMQESLSNMAGKMYSANSKGGMEATRQRLIADAMSGNKITPEQLAENVTRYIPVNQHSAMYNKYKAQLGADVANRYRGAFVL
jgi:hypothetical protein